MTREEAINEIKSWDFLKGKEIEAIHTLIPELRESEDERIRKELVDYFASYKIGNVTTKLNGVRIDDILNYLEKQKEPPFVKDVMLGYPGLYFYDGERMHFQGSPAMEEKQKEPHYTKRNALFDECVKNCDPKTVEEVNKRVDDIMNMSELSAFEQALTNFIGSWEDDEERWPSKFVKKHGKHILDMAREELQKEQKPIVMHTPRYAPPEQKPTEWNNEDDVYLNIIVEDLKELYKKRKAAPDSILGKSQMDNISWFKSLPERFDLRPKQKWSEEDESKLNHILEIVHIASGSEVSVDEKEELESFLKSLRPQQKDDKCISPKEGDIVVNEYGEISVFESWGHHPDGGSFNDKSYFFAKCTLEGDYYVDYDCHPDSVGLRYATPEEIRKIVPYLLKSLRP